MVLSCSTVRQVAQSFSVFVDHRDRVDRDLELDVLDAGLGAERALRRPRLDRARGVRDVGLARAEALEAAARPGDADGHVHVRSSPPGRTRLQPGSADRPCTSRRPRWRPRGPLPEPPPRLGGAARRAAPRRLGAAALPARRLAVSSSSPPQPAARTARSATASARTAKEYLRRAPMRLLPLHSSCVPAAILPRPVRAVGGRTVNVL